MNDMKQPEAIRLADNLGKQWTLLSDQVKAAAELRRLHAANVDCMEWYEAIKSDYDKLKAEHEALRKAVIKLEDVLTNLPLSSPQRLRARIQRHEEMLAAVGAGGVGPLIPATVQHQHESSSDNELQRKTGDLITTAAPPQTGGIPPNWQLVPMEATGEMIDAARGLSSFPDGVYRNMLAAAPQPPTTEQSSAVQPQVEQEPGYLDGGSRYKVTHLKTSGYCIIGLPGELLGCWVALVDATDNKHIDGPQPKREPLTDDDVERLWYQNRGVSLPFTRAIERAHGIGGEA